MVRAAQEKGMERRRRHWKLSCTLKMNPNCWRIGAWGFAPDPFEGAYSAAQTP